MKSLSPICDRIVRSCERSGGNSSVGWANLTGESDGWTDVGLSFKALVGSVDDGRSSDYVREYISNV